MTDFSYRTPIISKQEKLSHDTIASKLISSGVNKNNLPTPCKGCCNRGLEAQGRCQICLTPLCEKCVGVFGTCNLRVCNYNHGEFGCRALAQRL